MLPYRFVVVEGNIGAGKTTLATKWASHFGAKLILEEFADNPFLPKFYENPERYAFPLELSFLSERFSQLKKDAVVGDIFQPLLISDYIISKCQVFAKNNLNEDEYALFLKMFEIVQGSIPAPDLVVYLYRDTNSLLQNIEKRGRTYEQKIDASYLENIQNNYLEFLRQHPELRVVMVNCGSVDFVRDERSYFQLTSILENDYPTGITRVEI